MRQTRWLVGLVLGLMATLALGGTSDLWLHVKVEDDRGRGESVNINLPLSVVEDVLPLIETAFAYRPTGSSSPTPTPFTPRRSPPASTPTTCTLPPSSTASPGSPGS